MRIRLWDRMLGSMNSSQELMMTPKNVAVLIAQPDRFRESLQILLTSISRIDEVFPVESLTEAFSLAADITPCVVILDSQAAKHDLPAALKRIGDTWQGASRIALVEDHDEHQKAAAQGADLVLLKGFNAATFIHGIEGMLNNH